MAARSTRLGASAPGVRALTVVVRRPDRRAAQRVSVTAPARVRRIVKLVNRFPVSQRVAGAMVICPLDVGPMAEVSFFRHRGDPTPVAVAEADGSGCGTLSLEVGHRRAPALAGGPRLIAALGVR